MVVALRPIIEFFFLLLVNCDLDFITPTVFILLLCS